jgi:hypothetical protein
MWEGVKPTDWGLTPHTTPKFVLIHSGFHWILNEFGQFFMVKLVNPLMNGD